MVRSVLDQYRRAYSSLDANAVDLRYDIVDRAGKLAGIVIVPKNVRILAAGATSWYAVYTDNDDSPHLRRYTR